MVENNKYFTSFCSVLNDGECKDMMQKVEEGSMSNEDVYAKLIEKHGDDEIARAHLHAAKAMEEQAKTPIPGGVVTPRSPTPVVRTDMAVKIKTLQEEKSDVKPSYIADVENNRMPNPPSAIPDLCRVCVAPISIGLFSVLESWHPQDKGKIDALMEQIEKEEINIEDAYTTILTEIPNSVDSLNRILNDLNLVLQFALNKAGEKSPRLKERFDQELAEMQGEEEGEV